MTITISSNEPSMIDRVLQFLRSEEVPFELSANEDTDPRSTINRLQGFFLGKGNTKLDASYDALWND